MITEEKIQAHIDEAKKELNRAIVMAYEKGKQDSRSGAQEDCATWSTSRGSLQDGKYVGVLPNEEYVFVSVVDGHLFPVEYCKNLVKWLKLPNP